VVGARIPVIVFIFPSIFCPHDIVVSRPLQVFTTLGSVSISFVGTVDQRPPPSCSRTGTSSSATFFPQGSCGQSEPRPDQPLRLCGRLSFLHTGISKSTQVFFLRMKNEVAFFCSKSDQSPPALLEAPSAPFDFLMTLRDIDLARHISSLFTANSMRRPLCRRPF